MRLPDRSFMMIPYIILVSFLILVRITKCRKDTLLGIEYGSKGLPVVSKIFHTFFKVLSFLALGCYILGIVIYTDALWSRIRNRFGHFMVIFASFLLLFLIYCIVGAVYDSITRKNTESKSI